MYTTNQTKQFCVHNPYFTHYRKYKDFDDRDNLVLAERYFRKYKKPAGYVHIGIYGYLDHLSLNRNTNYRYAWNEFKRKFPGLEQCMLFEFSLDELPDIEWFVCCRMNDNGEWHVHIIGCEIFNTYYDYPFPIIGTQTSFEYKGILDKEHIKNGLYKYFEQFPINNANNGN